MSDELNYREDLQIDADALDVEWTRQPELYMRYCEAAADAKRAVERAHEEVKIIRSELLLEARENGGENQNQEEAYYRTHPRHKGAKQAMIEAQHSADLLMSAQFAFNQRKDALENLVRLSGQGYFAAPQAEADALKTLRERIDERATDARTQGTAKLKDRRRRRK